MFALRTITATTLFILGFSVNVFAASEQTHLMSIKDVCHSRYSQCLERLPAEYAKLKKNTKPYYILKTFEFEALFQLSYVDRLHNETKKYVDNENITSKEFQFLTLIYHAKTLFSKNDTNSGLFYLDKAKGLYLELKTKISNPIYLVHFGNISLTEASRTKRAGNIALAKEKYLETKRLLLTIQKDYFHYNNPEFQQELYANLFHAATALNQNSSTIEYSQKALFWTKQNDNQQQIGIALYNLARAYQKAEQYSQSRRHYLQALKYFVDENDIDSEIVTYYRMVELAQSMTDIRSEKKYFSKLDELFEEGLIPERLEERIKKAKANSTIFGNRSS